jgi:hypothetical protein
MWLITTAFAAIIFTSLWVIFKKRFKLGFLSLMLWGATIMILVDHLLGYTGGSFVETETGGLIQNATLLGILMLTPIFVIWLSSILLPKLKKI